MSFKFAPTKEQQLIIKEALAGKNLLIQAGAGAAKTTTLVMIAEEKIKTSQGNAFEDSTETQLYMSFNSSIAKEAKEKFPSEVDCRTAHSIAWEYEVRNTPWAKKNRRNQFEYISSFLPAWEAQEILQKELELQEIEEEEQSAIVSDVIDLCKGYCQSNIISTAHFVSKYFDRSQEDYEKKINRYIPLLGKYWKTISNKNSGYKISHDIYLKVFQLSKKKLEDYSVIYIDEFQDTNPVTLDIFLNQTHAQLIAVGDSAQSIYAWRGAVDAFRNLPDKENWEMLTLTESFRFNKEVEVWANKILDALDADIRVIGSGKKETVETQATLVRNNATLFEILLAAADAKQKVNVIADLKELWSMMYTAATLLYTKPGQKPNFGDYPHKQIAQYKSWKELSEDNSPEIRKIVKLVKLANGVEWQGKYGVSAAIAKAKSAVWDRDSYGRPDFTLSTGHKSKGLEWDEITLTDDFLPNFDRENCDREEIIQQFIENQGLQLLYVAITRAKVHVNMSYTMQDFINELEEYV